MTVIDRIIAGLATIALLVAAGAVVWLLTVR